MKEIVFPINCDCVLLDIEGTTSSVSFVYDKMFPYVREHLRNHLQQFWSESHTIESVQLMAQDLGRDDWPDSRLSVEDQRQQIIDEVLRQMDGDIKATGLKSLQGQIWKSGFESGQLKAHVYEDVKPSLEAWKALGKEIRIYSSGSVFAQLLFFGHTVDGDLLAHFSGHYDTKMGSKKEVESYRLIAEDSGHSPERILFVSDIVEELDAAKKAGMKTLLSVRPGNAPVDPAGWHSEVSSFDAIRIS